MIEDSPLEVSTRPKTSKGVRNIYSRNEISDELKDIKKRRMSMENAEDEISLIPAKVVKRNMQHPLSATVKRTSENNSNQLKLRLKSSLDP